VTFFGGSGFTSSGRIELPRWSGGGGGGGGSKKTTRLSPCSGSSSGQKIGTNTIAASTSPCRASDVRPEMRCQRVSLRGPPEVTSPAVKRWSSSIAPRLRLRTRSPTSPITASYSRRSGGRRGG
jgi:hypothetical protein